MSCICDWWRPENEDMGLGNAVGVNMRGDQRLGELGRVRGRGGFSSGGSGSERGSTGRLPGVASGQGRVCSTSFKKEATAGRDRIGGGTGGYPTSSPECASEVECYVGDIIHWWSRKREGNKGALHLRFPRKKRGSEWDRLARGSRLGGTGRAGGV